MTGSAVNLLILYFLPVKNSWHIPVRQKIILPYSLKSTLLSLLVSRSLKMASTAPLLALPCTRQRRQQLSAAGSEPRGAVRGASGRPPSAALPAHSGAAPSALPCSACGGPPPCQRICWRIWWGGSWLCRRQTCRKLLQTTQVERQAFVTRPAEGLPFISSLPAPVNNLFKPF